MNLKRGGGGSAFAKCCNAPAQLLAKKHDPAEGTIYHIVKYSVFQNVSEYTFTWNSRC